MHPTDLVRRPLNDDILAVQGCPLVGLRLPMTRVDVHPSDLVAGENLLDRRLDFLARDPAPPLCRIPERRTRIRAIRRREPMPRQRLQPQRRPVTRTGT